MDRFAELKIQIAPHGSAEQRVPCPQCDKGDRDRALGVNIETGAFHCFRCNWAGRAGGESNPPALSVSRIDDPAIAERKRIRLRETWRQSVALADPRARPVCDYLASRGLGTVLDRPPPVLRAHPALEYWDATRSLGRYPAMVALFTGADDEPKTLHVTYIRCDGRGKAGVPTPKKILGVPVRGATKGGAIRLHEPRAGVLGVAEGIESALSLHLLQGVPVWAAFCAGNLQWLRLPAGLAELHIAVDVDDNGKGEQVAQALATRVARSFPQAEIVLWYPGVPGAGDLNDVIMRRRAS